LIHFETRANKPRVFRITPSLIESAKLRSGQDVVTSLGEDWRDLSTLGQAAGLVTAIDLLTDPKFPKLALAEAAPHLRWIHVTGAGIEPLLPLDWMPSQLTLTNNSGVHAEKARESALMMLLMLNARLPAMIDNQRNAHWQQIFTPCIRGRTVLIIGVGDMGGAVAKAARELGLRVLGVRQSGAAHPDVDHMYRPSDIDAILPAADFVICAVPLTRETTALIDRRRFGLMKKGVGFINIGRAGSVDYDALIAALDVGSVSGAVIDIYDPEPLPATSALWRAKNMVMMPHVSSDDEDEYLPKTLDLVFENVARLREGQPLLNVVDPARGY
jgi:phosphoglycerate dehydrogenase-like enzyme